jgi:hypothetical protein
MRGFMAPQSNIGQQGFPSPFNMATHPNHQTANRAAPDFHTTEFRQTPNGGTFYYSHSVLYRTPGQGNRPPNAHEQVVNNFSSLLQGLMGHGTQRSAGGGDGTRSPPLQPPSFMGFTGGAAQQHGQRVHDPYPDVMNEFFGRPRDQPQNGNQQQGDPMNALMDMVRMVLNGQAGLLNHNGDAATSQQDFDRIMSQLLEQAQQGGGEPPADRDDVEAIPKITVNAEWLQEQEHTECTICMEEAKLGDELSSLWCGHWYHPFCIKTWLDAHGACPLCRKTLKQSRQEAEAKAAKDAKHARRERRRSSRPHGESSGTQERRGYHDDGAGDSGASSSRSGRNGEAQNSSSGGFFSSLFGRSR